MDCVGRNWPLAGPAQTPRSIDAPTHKPPASHRHRPRLREHSHSSSVFTGVCSSRSSTSAKLRAGGRGDGSGEWESSHVVSGDAVRQSPGSTPLGRSILSRRGDGVGRSGPRRRVDETLRRATGFCHAAFGVGAAAALGVPPRQLAASRGPAVAAYTARQIPEDTTYLPSAAADGRCDCGARTEAAGGACRATACRRRGARAAQSTLPLSPDVFEWVSPSSVVRETSRARTTAPRRDR